MSEQMLNFHLHHLSNMGMWETGKHVHYVQCAVYVQYMYVRQSSTYSSTVRAVMSHRYFPCIYIRVVQYEVAIKGVQVFEECRIQPTANTGRSAVN